MKNSIDTKRSWVVVFCSFYLLRRRSHLGRTRFQMKPRFQTTRWTILDKIRSDNDSTVREGMEEVCQQYWEPVYFRLVASGYSKLEAEELTQDFFLYAIRSDFFLKANPKRGKLRSLMVRSLENFLKDRVKRRSAQKRGGGIEHISIEHIDAGSLPIEIPAGMDPSAIYELRWIHVLVRDSLEQLRSEYVSLGKVELFESIHPFITSRDSSDSFSEIADRLRMSNGSLRVAVHRMKKRFSKIVKENIAATLLPDEDVDEEMKYLLNLLKR